MPVPHSEQSACMGPLAQRTFKELCDLPFALPRLMTLATPLMLHLTVDDFGHRLVRSGHPAVPAFRNLDTPHRSQHTHTRQHTGLGFGLYFMSYVWTKNVLGYVEGEKEGEVGEREGA